MSEGAGILYVDSADGAPATAAAIEENRPGHAVTTAKTAHEGTEALSLATDCVVSAYDLPETDGLSFFEQVTQRRPDCPFILYTDADVADEAMAAGVTDFVAKATDTDDSTLLTRRVEAAVRHHERDRELDQYQTLVETVGDPMYIFDENGYVTFANSAMVDFLDSTREAVRGRDVSEMIPDDEYESGTERLQRIVQSSTREWDLYEITLSTDQGVRKHAECNISPLVENGEFVGSVGVIRDVSERTRGRQALEALHRVATTIQTEESVEAVCEQTVAAAADILDFALCSLMIREGEWLVPHAISDGAPEDGSRPMQVDEGLAGKTYQSQEPHIVDQVTPDDETDPAKDSYRSGISVPIDGHGVFQAVSTETEAFDQDDVELAELLLSHTASAIDRLERRQRLERQNERLEEFASVVSHDLRNPLNIASTRLELAREECNSEHLEAIDGAHERMETLIEDLLTLAREGDTVSEFESVDLASTARECLQTVPTGEVSLDVQTDSTVRADPSRLKQLLENLFRNAVDHVESDVTVTVGDLSDGDGFYVADDGPGISLDERDRVFEFGVTTSEGGTGFGLAIVEEIARAHDWKITATDSDAGGARLELRDVDIES